MVGIEAGSIECEDKEAEVAACKAKLLNVGVCQCRPEVDPRLAVLAKLLEDKESE